MSFFGFHLISFTVFSYLRQTLSIFWFNFFFCFIQVSNWTSSLSPPVLNLKVERYISVDFLLKICC